MDHKANFNRAINTIKENRILIYSSFFGMIAAGIVGYAFPEIFDNYTSTIIDTIISEILDKNGFEMISFIVLNNLKSALMMFLLGIVFLPVIGIILNGYLIGSTIRNVSAEFGISTWFMLLPHGIFEIPAICIALGLGLRIGMEWFRGKEFKKRYLEGIGVFFYVVVPLLIIAGIIEGSLIFILQ